MAVKTVLDFISGSKKGCAEFLKYAGRKNKGFLFFQGHQSAVA
jgi:hypothetical protein